CAAWRAGTLASWLRLRGRVAAFAQPGEAAQRMHRRLPGAIDQARLAAGDDLRLARREQPRHAVERLLAHALATVVDEQGVAGEQAVPGQATPHHVALLVGGELDPGAER